MKTRKDLIKNIAIVFLVIMLLLTFFSNTILNWSLPQVSGKYTEYGDIKTGVRGSGTVEANMTYTETVKGHRTVEAVYVNRGTIVNKGDLLMLMSPTEVEGIDALEQEIATMQEAYDRAMLGRKDADYSADELALRNAEEDLEELKAERAFFTEEYIAEVTKAAEDAEAEEERLSQQAEDLTEELEEISEHSTEPEIVKAREAVEKQKVTLDLAEKALERAEKTLEETPYTDTSAMEAQLEGLNSQVTGLETDLRYYKDDNSKIINIKNNSYNASSAYDNAVKALSDAVKVFKAAEEAYNEELAKNPDDPDALIGTEVHTAWVNAKAAADEASERATEANTARQEALALYEANEDKIKEVTRAIEQKESAIESLDIEIYHLRGSVKEAKTKNKEYTANKDARDLKKANVETEKETLENLTKALEDAVKRLNKSTADQLKAIKKQLEKATETRTEADSKVSELSVIETLDEQIKSAERSLESQKLSFEQKKESDADADALEKYDLDKQYKAIQAKKAELAELKGESKEGYELRATHAGTVTEVSFKAGEIATEGATAVVIEVQESGYTLSFSVNNGDAAKVKVGDTATVSDTYWGQNVGAVLKNIIPDAGGKTKTLVFELSGNVNVGQNLTLLVGERSTGYSAVIPKSALREDSKGKFVYITKTKSTPLGNRYIATRLDVTVAAQDDKNVAIVTDDTYLYEYVIVSSTKPFEEGGYVRLSD